MRTHRTVLLAVVVIALAAPVAYADRTFQIIPQAGLTLSTLASEPESLTTRAKVGYMVGGSLRFGSIPYVQPGVYYQRTTIKAEVVDEITTETFSDNLGVSSLWIPVQVGVNLINGDMLDLHLNGGPAATIVTSVVKNDFGLVKDNYESVVWGAVVGAGVDFAILSLDASYEFGLSKVLKEDDGAKTKQNVFRFAAGLRY